MEEILTSPHPTPAFPISTPIIPTSPPKKPWLRIFLVIALLVGVGIAGIYAYQNYYLQMQNKPAEEQQPNFGRILYYKNRELFSATADGKNIANLTNLGIKPDEGSEGRRILVSKDGQRVFYVGEYNVWSAKTDGTGIKKLTNYSPKTTAVELLATNHDGSKLFYKIQIGPYETHVGPTEGFIGFVATSTNFYWYDQLTDRTTVVEISSYISDYTLTELVNNQPIYRGDDDRLYKINPERGSVSLFASVKIEGSIFSFPSMAFINTDEQTITHNKYIKPARKDDAAGAQIVSVNLNSGSVYPISAVGGFTDYQYLRVSPKFTGLTYFNQKQGKTVYYNYYTKTARDLFNRDAYFPIWINEISFIYEYKDGNKFNLFKFNLYSGIEEKIIEGVDSLVLNL